MTRKLYYEDSYMRSFHASIVERGTEADGTSYVILDQTAFYPEGGGQPCDLGSIGDVDVTDVQEVEGAIRHRVAAALPETVTEVECQLDWERRFDHMQQHTGQHLLSAAFDELFEASTVAFHLGRETVTIDIATRELSQEMARQAERLANQVLLENRPIDARFVDEIELASMPLRKPPKVTENIRIVAIDQFDYNPCGGTHPTRTAEVGMIKILGWERARGNVRVEFVCGLRALQAFGEKQIVIKDLMKQLASQEAELPGQVARLLAERKELEHAIQAYKTELIEHEATALAKTARAVHEWHIVTCAFENRPIQELQKLAQLICASNPMMVVLCVSTGSKTQLVFSRGAQVTLAMNSLLKETLPLLDGKGGGTPDMAQGGGTGSLPTSDLFAYIVKIIESKEE
ncbi:MAG: alanyl-tRNA editing protein [Clostridia bacterium]